METRAKVDRRKRRARAYQLSQPLFIRIPKTLAAPTIVACSLPVMVMGNLISTPIWVGPIYLLLCAFGAWLVGNRFAVMLGFLMAAVQVLNDRGTLLSELQYATLVNSVVQFCSALAVVLMLGIAREALEIEWRFARLDPLTGALNRKAFFEAAESEKKRCGMTLLVFADVDGLKRLNDKIGHEAGDDALRNFAERVRRTIRKGDLFARIGGDEFVLLMKVRDAAAAGIVAERLNRVLNLEHCDNAALLKCSLGMLVLPTGSTSIDAELKQADQLMYYAKRERLGLMVAMSVDGGMQNIVPLSQKANPTDLQRAIVRSSRRGHDPSESDKPDEVFAA